MRAGVRYLWRRLLRKPVTDPPKIQTQTTFFGMDVARLDESGEIFFVSTTPGNSPTWGSWTQIQQEDAWPKVDLTIHDCTGDETCIFCPPPKRRSVEVSWEMSAISPHMVTVLLGREDFCVRGEPHPGHCVPTNITLGEE